MKVVVAGSRDLTHKEHLKTVHAAMVQWSKEHGAISHVVVGDCRGADEIAHYIARANDRPVTLHLAAWEEYGRSAGPRRNQEMIDSADGLVVVRYPDSRGAADVLRRAQAKGIPVVDVVLERPA